MKLRWDKTCLWHLAFLVGSAVVALGCLRLVPRTVEGFRFYHGDVPLMLPAELLLAKHLTQVSCIVPGVFAVLFLLSFFKPEVLRPSVLYTCGFGLAALYGLFVLVLSLCFKYALFVQGIH